MKLPFIIVLGLMATLAFAEKQPFERYQSIVDRQMFGPLPPGFDPTKSPNEVQKSSKADAELTQDQAKLKSAIRFFVIDKKDDGSVAVGFSDNSDPKTPKSYYLKVGESRDGWEVKEADSETATMTIAKGEVEVSLKLGGNSATDGNAAAAGGGASAAAPAAASASGGPSRRPGLIGGGLLGAGSLRARRMQRQQEAEAKRQEAKAAEEAREAERQAQAEADKQQREAERAEQRQQLIAIQEELKKVREAKAAAEARESNADNEAQ